ncbi:MAG: methyltransferase domain-containing protein [Pseudomonadota bacterium]
MDVLDFRDFYTTPLGDVVQSNVDALLKKLWPTVDAPQSSAHKNRDVTLAYGYTLPYLKENSTQLAFMPADMGVIGWPKNSPRIALVEEDLFPLPDRCVDRLFVIHGLEVSHNPMAFLEECWRVLSAEGKLLIIIPNRRGLWSRIDSTPLGRGQPYTMTQLSRLLRTTSFTPTQFLRTLYTPPFNSNLSISAQTLFEKAGPLIMPKFSGLIAIEASKTVYCGVPVANYSRRLKVALTTARATAHAENSC